jgi:hypothetical protein
MRLEPETLQQRLRQHGRLQSARLVERAGKAAFVSAGQRLVSDFLLFARMSL